MDERSRTLICDTRVTRELASGKEETCDGGVKTWRAHLRLDLRLDLYGTESVSVWKNARGLNALAGCEWGSSVENAIGRIVSLRTQNRHAIVSFFQKRLACEPLNGEFEKQSRTTGWTKF